MGHGRSGGGSKFAEGSRAAAMAKIAAFADPALVAEMHGGYSKWYDSLTPEDRALISAFTYSEFKQINKAALEGTSDPKLAAKVDRLNELLMRSRIPANTTAFRGIGRPISTMQARQMIGTTVGREQFTSTSLNFETATQFVGWQKEGSKAPRTVYQFNMPKGSRGALISPLSGNRDEHELLLPKGARFQITGVRTISYRGPEGDLPVEKYTIIQANYLGPKGTRSRRK